MRHTLGTIPSLMPVRSAAFLQLHAFMGDLGMAVLPCTPKAAVPHSLAGWGLQCCQAHWTDPPLRHSVLLQPLARIGASVTGIQPEQDDLQAAVLHTESDVELAERLDYQAVAAERLASTGVFVILLACCSSSWECSGGCSKACCLAAVMLSRAHRAAAACWHA